MDDLVLNNNTKTNFFSLKGKDWCSLQNLVDPKVIEENDNFCFKSNCINNLSFTNGDYNQEYSLTSNSTTKSPDTMKLNKEDVFLFGHRPAHDQFYLVVCEFCKKVIKPQALSKHIEVRHNSKNNLCNNNIHINQINPFITNIKTEKIETDYILKKEEVENSLKSLLSSNESLISVEKIKQNKKSSLSGKLKSSSKLYDSKSNSTSSTASSPTVISNTNDILKKTRVKLLPCKDRKYDPDKHCGVRLLEQDQPCTRSLTCKTHSLTLRRSVAGRSNAFDKLLIEHRLAKEAALRAAGIEVKPTKLQLRQQQRMQKNSLKEQNSKDLNVSKDGQSTSINYSPVQIKKHLKSPSQIQSSNDSNYNLSMISLSSQNDTKNSETDISNLYNKNQLTNKVNPNNNYQLEKMLSNLPSNNINSNINLSYQNSMSSINQANQQIYSINTQLNNKQVNEETLKPKVNSNKPIIQNLKISTMNHQPRPAAVCTFNARQLSIFTQTKDREILSSRLFDRKQDFTYSALSIFCNREKTNYIKDQKIENIVNHGKHKNSNHKLKNYQNLKNDYSSTNTNLQETIQTYSSIDKKTFNKNGIVKGNLNDQKKNYINCSSN